MKKDDYDILNMSDEEILELEKAMMECELDMDEQKHKNKRIIFIVIISIVALLVAVFLITFRGCSLFESESKEKRAFAEKAAQTVVAEILKSPSTAIWNEASYMEDNGEQYIVYVDVEAQNSFGAYVRTRYFVVIKNINLDAKTFTYNQMFSYIECNGKDDTYNLNLIKSLNKYNEDSQS